MVATTAYAPRRIFRRPIAYRPPVQRTPHLRLRTPGTAPMMNLRNDTIRLDSLYWQDTAPFEMSETLRNLFESNAAAASPTKQQHQPPAAPTPRPRPQPQAMAIESAEPRRPVQSQRYRRRVKFKDAPDFRKVKFHTVKRRKRSTLLRSSIRMAAYASLAILLLTLIILVGHQALTSGAIDAAVVQGGSIQ